MHIPPNLPIIEGMNPAARAVVDPSLPEEMEATLYFSASESQDLPELLFFEETALQGSGWKRASIKGRRLWQRMKDRYDQFVCEVFAGDRFIRNIRRFRKIRVLLNQPIEPAVVKARLRQIMRDRSYHHLRWLLIDLALLPLTLFPMILPGPNVIGYYLLFRVFSHWKAYRSASNPMLDRVDIEVSSKAKEVSSLMRKAQSVRSGLHELRQKYGLRALQEHQFIPQSALFREVWSRWFRRPVEEEDSTSA